MGPLWLDIRYGIRVLRKAPAFTAAAVLSLGLGIGASTAVFSILNSVLIVVLPFAQPDHLFVLYESTAVTQRYSVSYPNFQDWKFQSRAFSMMAACRTERLVLTGEGRTEPLHAAMVSAEFFSTLGIDALLGRSFHAEDDRAGAARVAMLDEGFWKRRFAASREIAGRTVRLKGAAYTIIGVAPRSVHALGRFVGPADIYVPLGQWEDPGFRDRKATTGMHVIARRKLNVKETSAKADLDRVAANLRAAYPDANRDVGITMASLKEELVARVRPMLLALSSAVGFVLLIACANVGNLLLARSAGRAREFATRVALGASAGRLTRQLLTESMFLATLGGALGLALAVAALRAPQESIPAELPLAGGAGISVRMLLFTLVTSCLAAILLGVVPGLRIFRADLNARLKEGGRGSIGAVHRAQFALVVAEMALAVVLLAGAGLMIRSLANLWGVHPGFDPHNVLAFELMPSRSIASDAAKSRAWFRNLEGRLNTISGIDSASVILDPLPLSGIADAVPFKRESQIIANGTRKPSAIWYFIGPGYFHAMGIQRLRGRLFTPSDDEHSSHVAVIDEDFARSVFPNEDPIGKRIDVDFIGLAEIVGIVNHVNHWNLGGDPTEWVTRQMYFPDSQLADRWLTMGITGGVSIVARTRSEPLASAASARAEVEQMDGEQAMYGERSMEQSVSAWLAMHRILMVLLSAFASVALGLACVGIYGVLSCVVGQRTPEIAIRMALGAKPRDIFRLILHDGGKLVLAGIAIGAGASFALTRLLGSFLYGVTSSDPLTFAGVATLLAAVAAGACYIPARRATRVDPVLTLWQS